MSLAGQFCTSDMLRGTSEERREGVFRRTERQFTTSLMTGVAALRWRAYRWPVE